MPPQKNLSRGSLINWCDVDAEADADISKTICRPPPYGGVDIILDSFTHRVASHTIRTQPFCPTHLSKPPTKADSLYIRDGSGKKGKNLKTGTPPKRPGARGPRPPKL